MMMRKNSRIILGTSLLCLMPMLMSFVVYADLPDQIAVHWNFAGEPDRFMPKAVAAFGLPVLLAAVNIFSKIRLFNDPKQANASKIMRVLMVWLIPFVAVTTIPITLSVAMGAAIPIAVIIPAFVGVIFMVIGNYLPKNRQNYTIGIKLPWTLHSADNWNKTHRMAGRLFMAGGFVLLVMAFTAFESMLWRVATVAVLLSLVALPVLYSLMLYKKDGGTADENK